VSLSRRGLEKGPPMKCLSCGEWSTARERNGSKRCPHCHHANLVKSPDSGFICPFNSTHGHLLVTRARELKRGGKFIGPEITYCPVCDANWKEGDRPTTGNAYFD
jgi:DNA-directed RNA polymerase subunit RPC12/RpoP